MCEKLLWGQATIRDELSEMKTRLNDTERVLRDYGSKIQSINKILQELNLKAPAVTSLETSTASPQTMMAWQNSKLVDLEDRSRRSNLVVHGIAESACEEEESLKTKVISNVFKKKLGVECKSIARIHRLGREEGQRPVIAYF
uniref:Putative transposase domain-containing protein n=1 Tax=Rhipicephalus microplus TaxID=6941 RepID=A0A6M2D579_RHIMP